MDLITEKDLTGNSKSLWLKALSAMELKNYGYAVSLIQSILKEYPNFLDGRRLLRKAEIGNTQGKKSFFGGISKPSLGGGSGLVKKDPLAAIEAAEKMLESDPSSMAGNRLLKDAAEAAQMPETAAFALDTMHLAKPKDTKILHEVAAFALANSNGQKALDTFNKLVEIAPTDMEAVKGSKDASAMVSMKSGGWEEAGKEGGGGYRDLIKDKDEAISLEQGNRVVRSAEMIDNQLAELSAKYEEDPEALEVVRKIAELYEHKEDLPNAVSWYSYAASLTNNTDAMLVRKASDLHLKELNNAIEAEQEWMESVNESAEGYDDRKAQLDTLIAERAEMVLDECRERVEANPTDMQLRYELGEQLYLSGHFKQAMPELQKARQSPNARIKASNLLGLCMFKNEMFDLAANQFREAANELTSMDSLKKELTYNLALAYEAMGKKDEYLDSIKKIYESDMGYRDVDARVLASYDA